MKILFSDKDGQNRFCLFITEIGYDAETGWLWFLGFQSEVIIRDLGPAVAQSIVDKFFVSESLDLTQYQACIHCKTSRQK